MAVGLITALLAALCYAIGSILQAKAAAQAERSEGLDPRFIVRIIGQLPYMIGLAMDGIGFLLSLVALQFLPLFLSEALIASSVGMTAVLAVLFLKVKLSPLEKWAVPALIFGLVLLSLSADAEQAEAVAVNKRIGELVGAFIVVLLAGVATRVPEKRQGVAYAVVGGLAYSGMGVAARSIDVPDPIWHIVQDPAAYALVIYGLVGLIMFAVALQRASVTTVTAIVFGLETVLPSLVGIIMLGDRPRPGWAIVAIVGFVVAVGSSLILAGQSEPDLSTAEESLESTA